MPDCACARRKGTGRAVFSQTIVNRQGSVSDEDFDQVREAGYADGEVVEIVANVALNIFTNYFNHIAKTEVDFPEVRKLTTSGSTEPLNE